MSRRSVLAVALAFACGCSPRAAHIPENVTFGGPAVLPAPLIRSNAAPPLILALHFSSSRVRRGRTWSGKIVTSTNVASVEVRSNLFSINVPRRRFGYFSFYVRVLDVPPIFVRAYRVRAIARNSAGAAVEEDFPLQIL